MKHTPGPWHRNIKPATKYTTVWSGRNKHVAYVATSGLTPEEVEANICLIKAAPNMLKALKRLHDAASEIVEEEDLVVGDPGEGVISSERYKALVDALVDTLPVFAEAEPETMKEVKTS